MITTSIFNMKGGSGKTTLTIGFASYLRYAKNARVKLIDLEANKFPIKDFREKELADAGREGTPLYNYLKMHSVPEPYPIDVIGKEVNTYSKEDVLEVARKVNREIEKDAYDYLLLDFPAGFSSFTPASCLVANHLIDGIYIPTSTESQERTDALRLGLHFLQEQQPFRIVWNKLKKKYMDNPSILDKVDIELRQCGMICSKVRIKDFNKATEDSNVRCFIRTTLCWPDRYVQMFCPELVDLYEEIISFLNNK